jgi:hypothetical protein
MVALFALGIMSVTWMVVFTVLIASVWGRSRGADKRELGLGHAHAHHDQGAHMNTETHSRPTVVDRETFEAELTVAGRLAATLGLRRRAPLPGQWSSDRPLVPAPRRAL